MGYESKFYVVRKSTRNAISEDGLKWCEVIASIDMCKCYSLSHYMRDKAITDGYFYADDGNTKITEDRYGDKLTEVTPMELIVKLEDIIKTDDYWRYLVLLETVKSIYKNSGFSDDIFVLHYGY